MKMKPLAQSVAVATLLMSGVAGAEQLQLEEIVVTATKRSTNLMETSVAISAFDSSTIEDLGIKDAQDLAVNTPSLSVAPSRVSIRGIGRTNLALGSDPGVGLYVDGVYSTETDMFGASNFLDVERIEVLRGPQGTLYGRNSVGGAINFISKTPNSEELEGKVSAEVGNYDYTVYQGMVTGPLTDKLSAMLALSTMDRGGLQENEVNGQKYDEEASDYVSLSLQHMTTDRWMNTLKVSVRDSDKRRSQPYVISPYSRDYIQPVFDQDIGNFSNFPGLFPGQNATNPTQGYDRENPAVRDIDKVAVDFTPRESNKRKSATFISEFDFDDYQLKYTGGWSKFEYDEDYDNDGTNAANSGLNWDNISYYGVAPVSSFNGGYALTPSFQTRPFELASTTQSHELQLSSQFDSAVNFIGGLYYYNSEETQSLQFLEHNDGLMATYALYAGSTRPVSANNILYSGESELDTTSYAAYGQADWDITDATKITAGVRYSYDEKDGGDETYAQFVGDPADPYVTHEQKKDWSKVTGRLGIDHSLSENHFVYGFVATGYRSGGFNLMAPSETSEVDTVEPEELLSYEIGYKGGFMDNRINLATAFYYYDYQDLQVLKEDVVGGVPVKTFENAADATAWGIEGELTALLTEQLMLTGTYSYNQTEFGDYESIDSTACALGPEAAGNSGAALCTEPTDLTGNEFANSPAHQASVNLIYNWELLDLDWQALVSYQYTSEQYSSGFNVDEYDLIDSYDRWDARMTMGSAEQTWLVTAYVKNITDDRNVTFQGRPSTVSHTTSAALTDPRLIGLKLDYNF
ncbi:Vitamin B12 transporter BtuB [Sinobacterium norvegicum]|uniref:Vitamin B12 transporter BtuB n=2 Tax=Sinobacterium norvegicum TaxID=1641715 RepID=A0ABN8EI78_9GAMM|nr:Vitamin B12 transporter BtuB [Sinobacterium norvegicum]